jgi:hypothetical protein
VKQGHPRRRGVSPAMIILAQALFSIAAAAILVTMANFIVSAVSQ